MRLIGVVIESRYCRSGGLDTVAGYTDDLDTGYLACARCSASGVCASTVPVSVAHIRGHPLQPPTTQRCPNCSGTGKVMCPTCLCTGMSMASEHDPRIDPFD